MKSMLAPRALFFAAIFVTAAAFGANTSAAATNIAPGWRGRETYRIVNDDEFIETFALAEPGKDFATYSETRFRCKS